MQLEIIKGMNRILYICLVSLICFSACKKEEGCTDSTALNYDSNAAIDDGSCISYFDIAQGLWYFNSDCYDAPIDFDDILPDSVNIENGGANILSLQIQSPTGESVTILGDIDNNGIVTISEQEIFSIDTAFVSIPVTVSGDGSITSEDSGSLILYYKASIPNLFELFNFSCNISLFRQE